MLKGLINDSRVSSSILMGASSECGLCFTMGSALLIWVNLFPEPELLLEILACLVQ